MPTIGCMGETLVIATAPFSLNSPANASASAAPAFELVSFPVFRHHGGMGESSARLWHRVREHATHWVIGGVLLAATGFAPEEWLARTVHGLHVPEDVLRLWPAGIDMRVVPISLGVAFIVGDLLWRKRIAHAPTEADPAIVGAAALVRGIAGVLPLPDKPSIAVLPFNNLSGDPEQEYFSDGVAEDITTELSRTRWLFVIARNSSFTYKGRAIDVKQVAHELGVRYVLEGSVRRGGEQIRLTAQLIDAETGNHVWAERYDHAVADVFAVQDEITSAVTHAIAPAIAQAERRRALRKPPDSLDAWEAYQRGLWHLAKGNKDDVSEARDFFRRATEIDPTFATAHAMLAFALVHAVVFDDPSVMMRSLATAEVAARRAIDLDPDESIALAVLAWAALCAGNYDGSLAMAERAIAVNPNDVSAYLTKGRIRIFSGQPEAGKESLLTALRLSPRDPLIAAVLMQLASAYYLNREYAEAANVAQRAVRDHPEFPLTYRWLAASLGQLGRVGEAADALHRALAISRVSFDYHVRTRPPWYRPEDHDHLLDGLRKAGWKG
jgi:adenylate cyclase